MPTTMFRPPKGPKIMRPQPTVAIGQPMPQVQTIPEPIDGIGRYTGIKHFALGDGGAPEMVHVTPTRPGLPSGDAPGETPYAEGGTFMVGPSIAPSPTDGSGTASGQVNGGVFGDGPQTAPDPNAQLYNDRLASIAAQRNVYGLQGQTQAPQQAVYDARGRVIQAQGQQDAASAQYQQQQQQEDQRRLAEIQAINAAHQNGPDIMRAAEAEGAYSAEDQQDRALGVAPPATVQLPPGAPGVAGVRPKIMTQEAYLNDKAQAADAESSQRLKIAQNIVSLMGTNVAEAKQAADRAGLSLDEANNLVSQARNNAGQAGLDVQQDQLGQEDKVLYTDPYTGQGSYMSQAEADQKKADYDRQRALRQPGDVLYTDPDTGERSYMTQAEADRKKYDYQQGLNQQHIPQNYAQQQAAAQYATQQNGQGADLAGLTEAQVLNTIPTGAGLTVQYQAYQELVRRGIQRGLSPDQAAQAAEALIQQEMASRRGSTVITPPAFGGG